MLKNTKLILLFCSLLTITALTIPTSLFSAAKDSPVDLGTRRELFVDHYLIESLDGVELELQQPQHGGVAIRYDGTIDSQFSHFTTVLKDGPTYRMYYRCYDPSNVDKLSSQTRSRTCYAESPDGINWVKPVLGLFEVNGSRLNNVIMPFGEAFNPFIDPRPGVPASERYKANMEGDSDTDIVIVDEKTLQLAAIADAQGGKGLDGFVSADGIHWVPVENNPILDKDPDLYNHLDGPNVMFWSEAEQQFLCYQRHGVGGELRDGGIRATVRSTSQDFLHWSKPVPMTYSDTGSTRPSQHLYLNNTQPYFRAPHIYIALMARFQQGKRVLTDEQANMVSADPAAGGADNVSDGVLITSRPGSTRYDFTFRESFVRPGIGYRNWVSRTNYPSIGIVPTGENEMSFYVQRNYAQKNAYLERMVLRLDGFASVNAPYDGGEFLTKPFTFSGKELEINYSTSAAGGIWVEIQDAKGKPVKGFTLNDCPEIAGDEISRIVSWENGTDLSRLIGKTVRLRFRMHDADLFSFRFRP